MRSGQLERKNRGETTVGSRNAHRGTRVPTGTGLGKLKDKVEFKKSRRLVCYLRSGSYSRGAVRGPHRVPDSPQLPGRQLAERKGAQNPRLSLTCVTGADQIVCDCIASA